MKKLYFCTVSDSKFALETIALFNSLERESVSSNHEIDFTVLCLDNEAVEIYKKINPKIKTITLENLNDTELIKTKGSRKHGEFAQTSKAPLVCYLLNKIPSEEILVFVDSDIYFYSDPISSVVDSDNWSVLITSHWFTPDKNDLAKAVGIYNSGLVYFKNDNIGKEFAKIWRKQCIDWCYARIENGKYTDQLYLDKWPEISERVWVSRDRGLNVGTWNLKGLTTPLICYHFHGLKLYFSNGKIRAYPITIHDKKIYEKYITELQTIYEKIISVGLKPTLRFSPHPGIMRIIKQKLFKLF